MIAAHQRRPVLIVDDDAPVANSLRRLLQRAGFEVIVASGGKEAISLLTRNAPAVVISDYRMSDMSGIEVLKHAQQACPAAVRILISGYAEEGAFDGYREEDAFCTFFAKPWNDSALLAELRDRMSEQLKVVASA